MAETFAFSTNEENYQEASGCTTREEALACAIGETDVQDGSFVWIEEVKPYDERVHAAILEWMVAHNQQPDFWGVSKVTEHIVTAEQVAKAINA